MAKRKSTNSSVDSLKHKDKRKNIPTAELQDFVKDDEAKPKKILYPRDPSLDPQLVWKGKDEQDRKPLEVPAVPVYIQEKIHPQVLIEDLRRNSKTVGEHGDAPGFQANLFVDFNGIEFEDLIEFYQHEQNWSNRLILGDSLLVMNSIERPLYGAEYLARTRLGQGGFRILVTEAYNRRCAITRERTLPVLDAAHIKPYTKLGPHKIGNGLLLRSDLHKLFDLGYMTVTTEFHVEVSKRIREEYENGREYYSMHGKELNLPSNILYLPSREFIEWHNNEIYRK